MKAKISIYQSLLQGLSAAMFLLMILNGNPSFAKKVTEKEAIAIADIWYAMELNSGYLKIDDSERTDRLLNISSHQVFYLTNDSMFHKMPDKQEIIAYVIAYVPDGYIMIPADDRLSPVLAFNVTSNFILKDDTFMKTFIKRRIVANWENLGDKRVPLWDILSAKAGIPLNEVKFPVSNREVETFIYQTTPDWNQGTFYNETVISHNGNISGIPTGCTATAMAIKMRYHEWPNQGAGTHSYNDDDGGIQFSHTVNPGNTIYNWNEMPMSSLTAVNVNVENLMYQCGVTVDMNYEIDSSGAWPTVSSMNTHFRYRGTKEYKYGDNFGDEIKNSVIGGLPTICSSSNHTVVIDGYRDTGSPFYHVNCGWDGGSNDWYNLANDFPGGDLSIDRSYPYSSPNNWVYVDRNYGGDEEGSLEHPYNTIQEGYSNTPVNGQLWFKTGTYNGSGVIGNFDKAMIINSYNGIVVLE